MAVNDVAAKDAANKKPKPKEDNFFMVRLQSKGQCVITKERNALITKECNMSILTG